MAGNAIVRARIDAEGEEIPIFANALARFGVRRPGQGAYVGMAALDRQRAGPGDGRRGPDVAKGKRRVQEEQRGGERGPGCPGRWRDATIYRVAFRRFG